MADIFSLAPLQGITDFIFRKLICTCFKGIDKVYTPFLRLQNDKTLKRAQIVDVLPENNVGVNLIPQILCNNVDDFVFLGGYLSDLGYSEINWNLGCPYPMVAKRKLGSGLLTYPDMINSILETGLPKVNCDVSIKLRSGYESEEEIFKLLPILNQFPLKELIVHPRIARQMYKGSANVDTVEKSLSIYKGNVVYNGDIKDINSFSLIKNRLDGIKHWMIGRALISNPFLVEELISLKKIEHVNKIDRFSAFYNDLYNYYNVSLSGPGHLLNKMQNFWEYFSLSFSNSHKVWKQIKKSKSIEKLNQEVQAIFRNEEFV
ncbi:MAG: tRNA-dihydrouridine synthase family protein [Chloroflexia bacterium]|nr:tRNA-dihydrouridine synthase family protein [Chloroflexia bacterium]